jgi:hypothetical protein
MAAAVSRNSLIDRSPQIRASGATSLPHANAQSGGAVTRTS